MNVAKLSIELIQGMKKEFPKLRILPKKESTLCKAIGIFLRTITFGKYKGFENYTTTIGYKIYLSEYLYSTKGSINYDSPSLYELLRHERIHIKQYHEWKLLYGFSYLFILISLFTLRAKWESEAYTQSILAHIYVNQSVGRHTWVKRRGKTKLAFSGQSMLSWEKYLEEQFCTMSYLWMFPFKKKVRKWVKKVWFIAYIGRNCEDIDVVYPIKYFGEQ